MFCDPPDWRLWQFFGGQYSYQLALSKSEAAYVNILSSTSGLFTLLLAAIFPSTPGDKFTLSKLLATALNITGVVSHVRSTGVNHGTVGWPEL